MPTFSALTNHRINNSTPQPRKKAATRIYLVVGGYLINDQRLDEFVRSEGLAVNPYWEEDFYPRIARDWIQSNTRARPMACEYPRHAHPLARRERLLFITQKRKRVPHNTVLYEGPSDEQICARIIGLDSERFGPLFQGSEFVTVPDPFDEICLPGEDIMDMDPETLAMVRLLSFVPCNIRS